MSKVFVFLIRLYQKFLSPVVGRQCRFFPTCSNYALALFELENPLSAIAKTTYRILRCQPLCKGGFDYPTTKITPPRFSIYKQNPQQNKTFRFQTHKQNPQQNKTFRFQTHKQNLQQNKTPRFSLFTQNHNQNASLRFQNHNQNKNQNTPLGFQTRKLKTPQVAAQEASNLAPKITHWLIPLMMPATTLITHANPQNFATMPRKITCQIIRR